MNIVSLAMNMLTPAIIGRIASALGINSSVAQAAIGAALPAILGGMVGKAAQPSGLGVLTGLLGQQSPSLLGSLGSLIGGSGQADLVKGGAAALGSLFGNSTTNALAGAVGKFAGLPEGASSSLLGMLAPVALGTLAQQQSASNLNASGLASLLAGQKDNIAAAMPKGFGDLLKGTGLLDGLAPANSAPSIGGIASAATSAATTAATSVGSAARSAASSATSTVSEAARSVQTPSMPTASTGGMTKWLPWLAALAGLVLLLGWWQSRRGPEIAMPRITYENVDLGARSTALYESVKTSLGNVKDEASARAQLPKLTEQANALADMQGIAAKLPADARKNMGALYANLAPGLEGLAATALKAPGASGILDAVIKQIVDRVKALAKV